MILWVYRLLRQVRSTRPFGVVLVLSLVVLAVLGNAITFYVFDGPSKPELTVSDAIWYSVISITTIGYGDYSASTTGARIGTVVFIILIGLAGFSAFLGLLVDWVIEFQQKESRGLGRTVASDHVIIINFPSESRIRQIIDELRTDGRHKTTEVVILTDQIDTLPFNAPQVSFVRGSPLQEESLDRAGLARAKFAIILSPQPNDPRSDSIVASIGSVIEHRHPEIKTIAECMDDRHSILFESGGFDSVIFANRIVNHLLVQETHDTGVNSLIDSITTSGVGRTVYSVAIDGEPPVESYGDAAKAMIDRAMNLLAVLRQEEPIPDLAGARPQKGDTLLYLAERRVDDWRDLFARR